MTSARQSLNGITLKTLLENPELQHPPLMHEGKHLKEKEAGNELPEIDFSSAFLGPHLWEKTYDVNDFNLEYMDLDEFLGENSIPLDTEAMPSQLGGLSSTQDQQSCSQSSAEYCPEETFSSKAQDVQQTSTHVFSSLVPRSASFSFITKEAKTHEERAPASDVGGAPCSRSPAASPPGSTPPLSPMPIKVNFQCTEQDLALASVPGQEFNPCCTNFTDDELKPQPMIKKSKKIFVPEDMKDDKYWARRRKNNFAAKRSRDARRVKENQIVLRASYLETENKCLREEMEKIRLENAKLKRCLSKYEPEILKSL